MKLNTKTRYGLRAIIEIAIQENEQGVFQKDIAQNQEISIKYLDQIISELKSANLITTIGGKKSGYRLTKSPKDILVYDVYKAFNSPLKLIDCYGTDKECTKHNNCAAQGLWCKLNKQIIKFMESKTLEEIVQEQKKLNNSDEIMFYI